MCDIIDERHKASLPAHVWGDGDPEGVRKRAAIEVIKMARAARQFGVNLVNGFTGSSIWHLIYPMAAIPPEMIDRSYQYFAPRWLPILDEYQKLGIKFALELHPTEIAFDIVTAERAL